MSNTLEGKIALLTGAAGGIGSATAHAFAAGGARLALLDIDAAGLERLADRLREQDTVVQCAVADLSTEVGVRAGISEVLTAFDGQVDILIANVGKLVSGPIEDVPTSAWRDCLDINLLTHVWACSSVLPGMRARNSGSIVLVGSDQGLRPDVGLMPYSVAKAAVHALAQGLAVDYGPLGICINSIAPGMTRTPLVQVLMQQRAVEWGVSLDEAERRELARRGVPLGRLLEPEEVAAFIVHLATSPSTLGTVFNQSGGHK